MMWPFKSRPTRGEPPSPTPEPSVELEPVPSDALVELILETAHRKAIKHARGESFRLKLKKEYYQAFPFSNLLAEALTDQAYRYGLQYESSFERKFTFTKL